MTPIDRTPAGTASNTRLITALPAVTVLVTAIGAVILGLTGHPSVAVSVAAIGAGLAGSVHVTITIRR